MRSQSASLTLGTKERSSILDPKLQLGIALVCEALLRHHAMKLSFRDNCVTKPELGNESP